MPVPTDNKKKMLKIGLFIYVFMIFISLHISHVKTVADAYVNMGVTTGYKHPITASAATKMSWGQAFIQGFINLANNPFDVSPFGINIIVPLLFFALADVVILIMIQANGEVRKQSNPNKEHGSSKFNDNLEGYNRDFVKPYNPEKDPYDPNVIISDKIRMNLDNKATNRNTNTLVIGGSGTGKTFRFIKPNMAQLNCSEIITDPSGDLMREFGRFLIKQGVTVKCFSTSDMVHSNCYNPFDYIYDENGKVDETKVSTLIYLYLENANGAKQKSGDQFWVKSAKAFLASQIYYLLENDEMDKSLINFSTILQLTQLGKMDENNSSSQSGLDILMEKHRRNMSEKGVFSKALANYDTFKLAPAKTANSILITCAVDLQIFMDEKVKNLTRHDYENERNNLHLEKLGEEQTYLFINIPQANGTYNFLVAMFYSQLFDTMYSRIEHIYPHKYLIADKFDRPIKSMISDEEEGNRLLEIIKNGSIEEVETARGGKYYQIKDGDAVILEKSNKEALERVKSDAKNYSIKKGAARSPWHIRCLLDEFANSVTRSTPKAVGITDKSVA